MIKILQPGLYTSIQDEGRWGYRAKGVPLSGAMDQYAMHFANHLLGNEANAAVLEMTMMGPHLKFEVDTFFVITGATFSGELNGKPIENYAKTQAQKGDELKIKPPGKGVYGYIAFENGIQSETVLGSQSWYHPVTSKGKLEKGDVIQLNEIKTGKKRSYSSISYTPDYFNLREIKADKGPEWSAVSQKIQKKLRELTFTVGPSSNRMAISLEHEEDLAAPEIITAPVQPGTIQMTPSGKLVALMRDAQTSGGYSRIFQLNDEAITQLAQVQPNQKVRLTID